jgi:hypothetical protein
MHNAVYYTGDCSTAQLQLLLCGHDCQHCISNGSAIATTDVTADTVTITTLCHCMLNITLECIVVMLR